MEDKFISYREIFVGQDDIPEKLEPNPDALDPHITQDLVTIFKIKDIYNEMNNFIESKENKLDPLYKNLHYTYDATGQRNDYEYRQRRSKNILENAKWKEEVSLVKEIDKIEMLTYLKEKGLMVDKLRFIDESNNSVTCLSTIVLDLDNGDDEEDPYVSIIPEFVLNAAGNVELPEEDQDTLEINVDQIKEIIVDETKYTFLL